MGKKITRAMKVRANTEQVDNEVKDYKLEQLQSIKADIKRTLDNDGDITELVKSKDLLKNEINNRL